MKAGSTGKCVPRSGKAIFWSPSAGREMARSLSASKNTKRNRNLVDRLETFRLILRNGLGASFRIHEYELDGVHIDRIFACHIIADMYETWDSVIVISLIIIDDDGDGSFPGRPALASASVLDESWLLISTGILVRETVACERRGAWNADVFRCFAYLLAGKYLIGKLQPKPDFAPFAIGFLDKKRQPQGRHPRAGGTPGDGWPRRFRNMVIPAQAGLQAMEAARPDGCFHDLPGPPPARG